MQQMTKEKKYSKISIFHIAKLIFRSALLLIAIWLYITVEDFSSSFNVKDNKLYILIAIWIIFFIEMLLRFFPSNIESMGCQKQFNKNYKPTNKEVTNNPKPRLNVAVAWGVLNAVIGVLYFCHIIDVGILFIISLTYSVCDMICILFFCPFQTFFMKNRCCTTCQIYNWDYAMMFTPLLFVPGIYTWSLFLMACLLLIVWEIRLYKHPERFSERCNSNLSCANCQEKLCRHKKHLKKMISHHNLFSEKFDKKGL